MAITFPSSTTASYGTFGDLRLKFTRRLKGREFTPPERDEYLNDAIYAFLSEADFLLEDTRASFTLASGSRTVSSFPAGVFSVTSVRDTGRGVTLQPIDGHRVAAHLYPALETDVGPPEFYKHRGNTLEIFPLADSTYTLEITHRVQPTPRTVDADTLLIPARYFPVIVSGALARACLDDGDMETAAGHQEYFNDGLRQAIKELTETGGERYPQIVDDFYVDG